MNFRDSGSSSIASGQNLRQSYDDLPDSSFREKLNYSTHKPKGGNQATEYQNRAAQPQA